MGWDGMVPFSPTVDDSDSSKSHDSSHGWCPYLPSHCFFILHKFFCVSFLLVFVNTFQIDAEDSVVEMKEPTPGFTTHTGVTSDPSPAESTVATTEAKPSNGETDSLAALATLLGDENDVGSEMGERDSSGDSSDGEEDDGAYTQGAYKQGWWAMVGCIYLILLHALSSMIEEEILGWYW